MPFFAQWRKRWEGKRRRFCSQDYLCQHCQSLRFWRSGGFLATAPSRALIRKFYKLQTQRSNLCISFSNQFRHFEACAFRLITDLYGLTGNRELASRRYENGVTRKWLIDVIFSSQYMCNFHLRGDESCVNMLVPTCRMRAPLGRHNTQLSSVTYLTYRRTASRFYT